MTTPSAGPRKSARRSFGRIVVALDGPASSGKSSVGAAAAARLGLRFVDTGLLYRALTAAALREGIPPDDVARLVNLVDRVSLADDGTGRLTRVLLDGEDATGEARSHEVDAAVSAVAQNAEVRAALLPRQRALAAEGGIVVAGRDIGTVVLPDADLKLFLDASVEERALRRIEERGLDPAGDEAEAVREQLRARDAIDRGRPVAPLRAADDAVILETDGNTFDRTVDIVEAAIQHAGAALQPRSGSRRRRATSSPEAGSAEAPVGPPPAAPTPKPEPRPSPAAEPEPTPVAAAAREPASLATPAGAPEEPVRTRRTGLLEVAMRLDNDQTMLVRMVALLSRIGARLFANVRVEGLERIPRTGAVILAINHISNLDAFVTGAWITPALRKRRIHWLGKQELFGWPVFGWVAAHGGVHPVDRSTADMEAFRLSTRILEAGYVLLIFPEGTRSPTGELQVPKDGLATLAIRTNAAIVPVAVNNSDAVWPKGRRIPMPFPRRTVTVRIGEPFHAADVVPEGTDRRAAKSLVTATTMRRIAAMLEPRHRGAYADQMHETGIAGT